MEVKQQRREFKFVLEPAQVRALRDCIGRHLGHDAEGPEGYKVTSEYYDSPDLRSYWEKQFGMRSRRRLRSRAYGCGKPDRPPSTFLEIKHKLDGMTVKRRMMVTPTDVDALADGRVPWPESPWGRRVKAEVDNLFKHGGQQPVVQIQYWRHAYDDGNGSKLRITFDSDIRCRYPGVPLLVTDPGFDLPLLERGAEIMEIKTINQVPYWLRQLIGEFRLIPRGFSKYATALELHQFQTRPPAAEHRPSQSRQPAPA